MSDRPHEKRTSEKFLMTGTHTSVGFFRVEHCETIRPFFFGATSEFCIQSGNGKYLAIFRGRDSRMRVYFALDARL